MCVLGANFILVISIIRVPWIKSVTEVEQEMLQMVLVWQSWVLCWYLSPDLKGTNNQPINGEMDNYQVSMEPSHLENCQSTHKSISNLGLEENLSEMYI